MLKARVVMSIEQFFPLSTKNRKKLDNIFF